MTKSALPIPYFPYRSLPSLLPYQTYRQKVHLFFRAVSCAICISFFATFEARVFPNYGAIQIKSKEKGRHTGASPEALSVLRTGGTRSDLPLFSTKILSVMRVPNEPGQNLSKNTQQLAEELFETYGSPAEVDAALWQITVAAIVSREMDGIPPFERANYLHIYRAVSKIIFSLKVLK